MFSFKKYIRLVFAVFFILTLSACAKNIQQNAPSIPQQTGTSIGNNITKEPKDTINLPKDPLTGLPVSQETANTHPIAVMINNLNLALPQSGISQAGILYECLTEGEITRIMAIFNNYSTIEKIGPVRSARDYFIDMAYNYSAYYIHFGGSPQAYSSIKNNKVQDLDGISALGTIMFYRDKERLKLGTKMLEHSVFTTGEMILKGLEYKGYSKALKEQALSAFNFADQEYIPNGEAAKKVTVAYSKYCIGVFNYDEINKVYLREEFNKPQIDDLTGKQLSFKNVFVIYVPQKNILGDKAGRIDVTLEGTYKGLYITNGVMQEITYKKKALKDAPKYYDSKGNELLVNPGNSFICILSDDKKAAIE